MTQSTNINAVNVTNSTSTGYFNNFNLPSINVSNNINDALIGYFEQITESKESARALAGAVILTAINQGVDPMETLTEFTKLGPDQLTSYTAMFLNLSRKGTSYLGINNSPTSPKYITHMIRP
jgi:hypothetical protein